MQRPPYGLPVEYPEICIFRVTDDSIYPFGPNAIRSSFRVHSGLIFGLLSRSRFDSSRIEGFIPRPLSGTPFVLREKGGSIQKSFRFVDMTLIFSKVRASSRKISCDSSLRCLHAAPR